MLRTALAALALVATASCHAPHDLVGKPCDAAHGCGPNLVCGPRGVCVRPGVEADGGPGLDAGGGGDAGLDGGTDGGCSTCAAYAGRCGDFDDGCGHRLSCGCTSPAQCGGGGVAGYCANPLGIPGTGSWGVQITSGSVGLSNLPHDRDIFIYGWEAPHIAELRPSATASRFWVLKSILLENNCDPVASRECNSGVGLEQAVAHDQDGGSGDRWVLSVDGGAPVALVGAHQGWGLPDIGSPSFQSAFVEAVGTDLSEHGADGVVFNDVETNLDLYLGSNPPPAKYPTAASWHQAIVAFVNAVGPQLKARGLLVASLGYAPYPDMPGFWRELAPGVDGLVATYWEQSSADRSVLFDIDACCWTGHWDHYLSLADAAQDAGVGFYAQVEADPSNAPALRYLKGSFLLRWNGGDGALLVSGAGKDPWTPEWTTDLGAPLGPATTISDAGVLRRDFFAGVVLLNPTPNAAGPLALGETLYLPDGGAVSEVSLDATSAWILRRGPPP